jgi:hypothetical protein
MSIHSVFDGGKAHSLVFSFREALCRDEAYDAPEPNFLKWAKKSLFVDIAISGDEAMDKEAPKETWEAWQLFRKALEATDNLLELYSTNLPLFQKIAGQLSFLPSLISWHPDNERFNRELRRASQLGQIRMEGGSQPIPQHLAHQSPPMRYAYAIIQTIDLTLDTYEERLPVWIEIYGYGVKHPIPMSVYEEVAKKMGMDEETKRLELPAYVGSYEILPAWTKTLQKLRRPFNSEHVLGYWRAGKAMILEEMPDFHMRPEWDSYRSKRKYQNGAKIGAVQHAIFKDILSALRTVAGSNRRSKQKWERTSGKSSNDFP